MLQLDWCQDGEPQRWSEKILLKGSEDSKFLLLSQPTAPIGASSGTFFSLTLRLPVSNANFYSMY